MMIFFGLVISATYLFTSEVRSNLDTVGTNYVYVLSVKQWCKKMIAELEKVKDNSVINLAYLGGLQTTWANNVSNP